MHNLCFHTDTNHMQICSRINTNYKRQSNFSVRQVAGTGQFFFLPLTMDSHSIWSVDVHICWKMFNMHTSVGVFFLHSIIAILSVESTDICYLLLHSFIFSHFEAIFLLALGKNNALAAYSWNCIRHDGQNKKINTKNGDSSRSEGVWRIAVIVMKETSRQPSK